MKLKSPKARPPKKPTKHQYAAARRIAKSDPPVVCVSVTTSGLHYSIGNGDKISAGMFLGMVARGWLKSNADGLASFSPQSYRLEFPFPVEGLEAAE